MVVEINHPMLDGQYGQTGLSLPLADPYGSSLEERKEVSLMITNLYYYKCKHGGGF
jgi:hypothetical protein